MTLITHGFNSSADTWAASMADAVVAYPRRAYEYGSSAPAYWLSFDTEGYLRTRKVAGPDFADNPSGDILLLLDWNPYSGDLWALGTDAVSTKVVGPVVADRLNAPDFIPGLGGPLSRFPIHLVGHSRGGSLVCEIAKRLGERNIVVDQLTLLDPHPLNNDGFNDLIGPVDGTAENGVYENVLFADAYYQTVAVFTPEGTFVNGSFIRSLNDYSIDSGGYESAHSNVHLWYHGTLAVLFPLTSDGSESITAATRALWYAPVEEQGAHAGYLYSLRGGGDRREVYPQINQFNGIPPHGLNGRWSSALHIAATDNRSTLTRSAAERANIIEFTLDGFPRSTVSSFSLGGPIEVLATNVGSGQLRVNLTYSFNGQGTTVLKVFADRDENTANGWSKEVEFTVPATGHTPQTLTFDVQSLASTLEPAFYRIGALLASPSGTREYYAPQRIALLPNLTMEWSLVSVGNQQGFNFAIRGIRNAPYALETSADLATWESVATGNLASAVAGDIVGTGTASAVVPSGLVRYFRAKYRE